MHERPREGERGRGTNRAGKSFTSSFWLRSSRASSSIPRYLREGVSGQPSLLAARAPCRGSGASGSETETRGRGTSRARQVGGSRRVCVWCGVREEQHSSKCSTRGARVHLPRTTHMRTGMRGQAGVRPGLARRALRTTSITSSQNVPPPRFRVCPSLPRRTPTSSAAFRHDMRETPRLSPPPAPPALIRQTTAATAPVPNHTAFQTPSCPPARPSRPPPGAR